MTTNPHGGRIWIFIAVTALIAAVGALVYLGLQTTPGEVRALRTPGAFIAVTRGAEPLLLGANWKKWLLRVRPELAARIGGVALRPQTPAPLVLWRNSGPTDDPEVAIRGTRLLLVGSDGTRMVDAAETTGIEQSGRVYLSSLPVTCFPRRCRYFEIVPFDGVPPNPAPRGFLVWNGPWTQDPVWRVDPTPLRRSAGGVEVDLDQFQPDPVIQPDLRATPRPAGIDFRVYCGGQPAARDWEVREAIITDPTGNRWSFGNSTCIDRERIHVEVAPLELPREGVYRLELRLARVAHFPPDEVCEFRSLPRALEGAQVALDRRASTGGYGVRLTRLLGPNSGPHTDPTETIAVMEVSKPATSCVVRALEGSGACEASSLTGDGAGPLGISFSTDGRKGGGRLRLAVTPVHTFQFQVRPQAPSNDRSRKG